MAEGRKFENREMQKRYDESRPKDMGADKGDEHEEPDGDEQPIEDVVEEHGPADHVEIHSHHGGHVHKSTHHDSESAKEHVGKAFGEHESAHEDSEEETGDGGMGSAIPTVRE